jgi:hypothetical protein
MNRTQKIFKLDRHIKTVRPNNNYPFIHSTSMGDEYGVICLHFWSGDMTLNFNSLNIDIYVWKNS